MRFNTRKIIYPLEIDIYCPDYKIGIEFNGSFWHSSSFKKRKNKNIHMVKFLKCKEKNIRLIHIYQRDWELRKEQFINYFKYIFKKGSKIIF
jgi:G:T-mismatch repair DNA endonuclease (very short patch repair protein)